VHAESISTLPLRSFVTIFYPVFVFVSQPICVDSDYRSSCACHEELPDKYLFGDKGLAYILNPFFPLFPLPLLPVEVCS